MIASLGSICPRLTILTLSFPSSPASPLSLSLSAVAQERLCTRLGVQAISTAHCIGTAIHTLGNFSQIPNDVQNTSSLTVFSNKFSRQLATNAPEHNPQLQYTTVCYNICLPAFGEYATHIMTLFQIQSLWPK